MSEFDQRAREWDNDKMHIDRSVAIASELQQMIPLEPTMSALEYGAGTGILSFLLKDKFRKIVLMDSSQEMINVCLEKVQYYGTSHITPLFFNLAENSYTDRFDVIYNQMVLHHVPDYKSILKTFYEMMNPGGYLAIADLFPEDGSFHGMEVVDVHRGFDPEELSELLRSAGFKNTTFKSCFDVVRPTGRKYPVFLLVAQK